MHFMNLDIPWIKKLDDALLAPLGISQKMQICTTNPKNHTLDNISKNGTAMKSVFIHIFSWLINIMNINPTF